MTQRANLPPSFLEAIPWGKDSNPIWPASVFVLHRNLTKYNFPGKMNEMELLQSLELMKTSFLAQQELEQPFFLSSKELSPSDKELLFEHFLFLEAFQAPLIGSGFVLDNSHRFLAQINQVDHLQLLLIDTKGEWEKSWNFLTKLESGLNTKLDYAYSTRFGYLTADPTSCGTGLSALIYLHLPALIHSGQFENLAAKQKDVEVDLIGLEGQGSGFVGDLVILHNHYTLGYSEETLLHGLQTTTLKLLAAEKAIRQHLKEENNVDVKDQISRAFGLLIHSYQLQTKEALDALSLIKLGVDLGWITGIPDLKVSELFFKCRRGYLSHLFPEEKDFAQKRAEYLHKELQGMHFVN